MHSANKKQLFLLHKEKNLQKIKKQNFFQIYFNSKIQLQ